MAGNLSDYAENKILDHTVGKTSWTMPTNAYLALFTDATDDAGGGTEVSGNSYARVQTTGADWASASSGATTNAQDITFPTATGSWGTITHAALFDAATDGNMIWHGALSASKAIDNGDTLIFPAGNIDITLD